MYCNTLTQVRQQMYESFERQAGALFNLCDALLSEPAARSLAELSLSPLFARQWPSVYAALQDGRINEATLRAAWAKALLWQGEGVICLVLDSTSIARPEAECSADRGLIYVPNLPHASKPGSVGWQYSTLMLLPEQPGSGVGILDQRRIPTDSTAIATGLTQLAALRPFLRRRAILLADRWYSIAQVAQACQSAQVAGLLRLKRNRKLYRAAPPRQPGQRRCATQTWDAVASLAAPDPGRAGCALGRHGSPRQVAHRRLLAAPAFPRGTRGRGECHPRAAPGCTQHQAGPARELVRVGRRWVGDEEIPLAEVATCSERRYSQEHGYRFLKQDLLWTQAQVRTPAQFDRWSWLVACACNQLLLLKQQGLAQRHPWESAQRPLTPRQVRRVAAGILAHLGPPAPDPKPRGNAPGGPKGRQRTSAAHFPVVRKPKPVPTTRRKRA
jgi:hypothetical protein